MSVPLSSLLVRAFLVRGKARAFKAIPSHQLAAGLRTLELSDRKGKINSPHYWSKFYHDGRGPSRGNPILVWFRNPRNDPRNRGGKYPVRESDRRRLTKAEFQKWSRVNQGIINRYRRRTGKRVLTSSDYRAMNLPMIVAKVSPQGGGRVGPVSAFFSNGPGGGMSGFRDEANTLGRDITNKYVRDRLNAKGLLHKKVSVTLRI